jgi:hypothetical protein
MDAPTPPAAPAPTFRSELLRGVNAYNLSVGVAGGLAIGLAVGGATALRWLPDFTDTASGAVTQGLAAAAAGFVLLTAVHTAAHAWCGYFIEAGMSAAARGDHVRAVELLAFVERPGMDHYDEDGIAWATLAESRRKLAAPSPSDEAR